MVPFAVGFVGLAAALAGDEGELGEWLAATWGFAKQILPLLLAGVLVAGLLLGRPGHEGLIPAALGRRGGRRQLARRQPLRRGGRRVHVLRHADRGADPPGARGQRHGQGPALTLLLAGPALSLPAMLVLRSFMGGRKTAAFVTLVVVMAATTGLLYGALTT